MSEQEIPPQLIQSLLKLHSEDGKIRISQPALNALTEYLKTFVREAIYRAAAEREQTDAAAGVSGRLGSMFIEVGKPLRVFEIKLTVVKGGGPRKDHSAVTAGFLVGGNRVAAFDRFPFPGIRPSISCTRTKSASYNHSAAISSLPGVGPFALTDHCM